jgi:hypothetical protein
MSNFLSQSNKNTLYSYIQNELLNKLSFDINSSEKYRRAIDKIILSISKNGQTKSLQHLNNIVIEKSVPILIKSINNNKNNNIRGSELNTKVTYQSNRPINSSSINIKNSNNDRLNKRHISDNTNYKPVLSDRPELLDHSKASKTQTNNNFMIKNSFKKNDINVMLNSLEVVDRGIKVDNSNKKETLDYLKKIEEERNYTLLNQDKNNFDNKIDQANKTQEIIYNKIQNNKSDDKFLDNIKNQRRDLDFDPQSLYMTNNTDRFSNSGNKPIFNLESKDFSKDNIIKGAPETINNESRSDNIKNATETSLKNFYQPEGYVKERQSKELVLLDSGAFTNNAEISFDVTLVDSLVLDKQCDVFLEFMSLQSLTKGSTDTHLENLLSFVISIDELPMKTASNVVDLNDKYIIPNESYGKSLNEIGEDTGGSTLTSVNVKLKSNYMTTITPQTFNKFTIKIYGYTTGGALELLKSSGTTGRVILGLLFKKV